MVASEHKTNAEIVELLAERFPKPDVPTRLVPMDHSSTPHREWLQPLTRKYDASL